MSNLVYLLMFKQKQYLFSILFVLLVLFPIVGCKKKLTNSTTSSFKEYYDTSFGRFIEYRVLEINHDINASIHHDTLNYFLRVQIEDTIVDNLGRINKKYVRYKRNDTLSPWQISDVWMTIIDGNNAELVEENQRIIKLKFPINTFTSWNASIFNPNSELICNYENIHSSKSINGFFFDSTITVNQGSDRNLIRFYKKNEVYAKNIGMICKYFKDINISNFDTLQINSGKEIYLKIINFGK